MGGVSVGYFTNVGMRAKNDDFGTFEVFGNRLACALADGIGGASFGNMAARVACLSAIKRLQSIIKSEPSCNRADGLVDVLAEADNAVCELKHLIGTGDDGTTLLIALQDREDKGLFHFAWIGDTIAFHFKAKEGLVAPLGNPGRASVDSNRLDGALGYHADVASLSRSGAIRMSQGDFIVMCTDGIWDVPGALEAESLVDLASLDPDVAAKKIVKLAVDILGGSDNASAIVVKALPELF